MKNILIFLSCFIYFSEINANETIDKKEKVISEIFEVIDVEDAISTFRETMVNFIKQRNMSPELEKIYIEETERFIQEEFIEKGFLFNLHVESYNKHFTLQELEQILAWHKSAVGKKLQSILPELTSDILASTKKYWAKNSRKIHKRINRRIRNQ